MSILYYVNAQERSLSKETRNQIATLATEPNHSPHHHHPHPVHHVQLFHKKHHPTVTKPECVSSRLLLFQDLEGVRPIPIKALHYLKMEDLHKLPVLEFMLNELGVNLV